MALMTATHQQVSDQPLHTPVFDFTPVQLLRAARVMRGAALGAPRRFSAVLPRPVLHWVG